MQGSWRLGLNFGFEALLPFLVGPVRTEWAQERPFASERAREEF
jgi:hypothetical protein